MSAPAKDKARGPADMWGAFPYGTIKADEGHFSRAMREDQAERRATERASAIAARDLARAWQHR